MSKQLILISGGSGYIGSHTIATFLASGYRVRVTGRNQRSIDNILATHNASKDSLEIIQVPDITKLGAYDKAVEGVDGVVHMASPFTFQVTDNETDLILPAINGTLRILESVVKHAPRVRRVVVTSSFAAIIDFSKGMAPDHVYDESQWNHITYEQTRDNLPGPAYAGSKKLAEEAAWKFVRETPGVQFTLTTVNPVMVYGPPLPGSVDLNHLGTSMNEIYQLMNGSMKEVPVTRMPVFTDVRDVALAHRLAYETRESGRFAICKGHFTKAEVCQLFRERFHAIKDKVPAATADEVKGVPHYTVDTTRAEKILGIKFRPLEDTFLDMGKAFLDLEAQANTL